MKTNIKSNQENEQNDEQEKQIIEHMPYLSLLLEDVRELNRALREGKPGLTETENLLTDLPIKWSAEIQTGIKTAIDEYKKDVAFQNQYLKTGVRESIKNNARHEIIISGQKYSMNVKQLVISVLDSKDILLVTKKSLAGKTFRIDAEGIDDE